MTHEQLIAIKKVEMAMKNLKDTGLAITGLEDSLVAFKVDQFRALYMPDYSIAENVSELDYVIIKCPYVDKQNLTSK